MNERAVRAVIRGYPCLDGINNISERDLLDESSEALYDAATINPLVFGDTLFTFLVLESADVSRGSENDDAAALREVREALERAIEDLEACRAEVVKELEQALEVVRRPRQSAH